MGNGVIVEVAAAELHNGDTVHGRVRLLDAFDKATGLDVFLETSGTRQGKNARATVRVHNGPLAAGDTFEFALTIPMDAPFTFEGHAHSINWVVKAQVDVPWKIDPKGVAPLVVRPRTVGPEDLAQVTHVEPKPKKNTHIVLQALLWALVLLIGLAFLPILPLALIWLANKKIVATRVSDYTVHVPERHFAFGEWVPVTVRFRLKRAVDVVAMTLNFKGSEQWSTGSGDTRSTHYHHFHESEQVTLKSTVIALVPPGGGGGAGAYRSSGRKKATGPFVEWHTAVQIPPDGLPSVGGSVSYALAATTKLRGMSDPSARILLPMVGARLEGGAGRPDAAPVQETSGDVAFVPNGTAPPPGVDATVKGGGVWLWIALSTLGVGAAASATFALSVGGPEMLSLAVIVAGVLALVGGLAGFYNALYR